MRNNRKTMLGQKEKKILYALEANSRATFKAIAQTTKIHPETVKYAFYQLKKHNILRSCIAIINPDKHLQIHSLYIKLQKATTKRKEQIIAFLQQNKNISWIAELQGNYDLAIIIQSRSTQDLNDTLNTVYRFFGKEILKRNLCINSRGEFLTRDYLIHKQRQQQKPLSYEQPTEEQLDELDKAICQALAKDARTSALQLAKDNDIAVDTAIRRIRRLEQQHIIQGYTILIDNKALEQTQYKLAITLQDYTPTTKTTIKELARTNNRVIAIIETLGEWDLEIDLEVENTEQLRTFLNQLIDKVPNTIQDYQTIEIVTMRKFNFLP